MMDDEELKTIEARLRMVTGEKWYRSADSDEVVQLTANKLSSTDTVEYYSRDIASLISEVRRLREIIKKKDDALERAIGRIERPEIVTGFSIQSKVLDLKEALAIGTDEKK